MHGDLEELLLSKRTSILYFDSTKTVCAWPSMMCSSAGYTSSNSDLESRALSIKKSDFKVQIMALSDEALTAFIQIDREILMLYADVVIQ